MLPPFARATPFVRHWYESGDDPFAATVKVTGSSAQTITLEGLEAMDGGMQAEVTVVVTFALLSLRFASCCAQKIDAEFMKVLPMVADSLTVTW